MNESKEQIIEQCDECNKLNPMQGNDRFASNKVAFCSTCQKINKELSEKYGKKGTFYPWDTRQ